MSGHQEKVSKKHHFVPQFLLKHFSKNQHNLWVYDKLDDRSYGSNVLDIACENYFNTITEGLPLNGKRKDFFESSMSPVDTQLSTIHSKLLNNLNSSALLSNTGFPDYYLGNENELHDISWFGVFQSIRTKQFREHISKKHEEFKKIRKSNDEKTGLFLDPTIQLESEESKVLHFLIQGEDKLLVDFINLSIKKVLVIGVNNTSTPFLCTDNPVTMNNHSGTAPMRGTEGSELSFPISEKYILIWICPTLLKNEQIGDSAITNMSYRTIELDETMVQYFNSLLYCQASQYIYSSKDEFSALKDISYLVTDDLDDSYRKRKEIIIGTKKIKYPFDFR